MKRDLMIYFMNDQDKEAITYSLKILLRRAVEATLDYEKFENDAQVSMTFTDNEGIKELNAEYRDKDAVTDVLSFPIFDDTEDEVAVLGDIVLCLSRADEQAKEYGHSFEREVAFLTVHSVLHLLGYDHETGEEDEREMFDRQRLIMEYLEIER